MSERWLPVVGWEGLYEVSDRGRVRSLDRLIEMPDTRWGGTRTRFSPGVVLKPHLARSGHGGGWYFSVGLKDQARKATLRVNRLVLLAFVGPCLKGFECAHKDGNSQNNALRNLMWKTPKENAADKALHGTVTRIQTWKKIGPDIAKEIVSAVSAGFSQKSQREKYGLSAGYVSLLVNNKRGGTSLCR